MMAVVYGISKIATTYGFSFASWEGLQAQWSMQQGIEAVQRDLRGVTSSL